MYQLARHEIFDSQLSVEGSVGGGMVYWVGKHIRGTVLVRGEEGCERFRLSMR